MNFDGAGHGTRPKRITGNLHARVGDDALQDRPTGPGYLLDGPSGASPANACKSRAPWSAGHWDKIADPIIVTTPTWRMLLTHDPGRETLAACWRLPRTNILAIQSLTTRDDIGSL